jgi:hypothetical protein
MGLEVNLAALDGRRERVKLTSQLSRGVGSGTQERRPRRSTTRTGRVGAFSTAEGRFHVRERFSIFRLRAETWVFEGPKIPSEGAVGTSNSPWVTSGVRAYTQDGCWFRGARALERYV